MNFYIFNIYSNTDHKFTDTVIFDYQNDEDYRTLESEVREFHTFNYKTDRLCLLTPSNNVNKKDLILEKLTGLGIKVEIVFYGSDGECVMSAAVDIDEFKKQGLLAIFNKNDGVLESDASYHYVLPSGKHSPFFLRVGNILNHQAEIFFIGYCLLQYFKDDTRVIYYDTSSILTIVQAALQLSWELGKRRKFELKSFSSYNRYEEVKFVPDSLVVMSASNSGNLQKRLKIEEPTLEVVTVIFNGKSTEVTHLLNVSDHKLVKGKKQFGKDQPCDYCKNNSVAVNISGEQFLPLSFAKRTILINRDSKPPWLNDFLKHFAYRGVFKCNVNEGGKRRELYLDLRSLNEPLENAFKENGQDYKEFEAEYFSMVNNIVPFSLKYIIYVDDEASKKMAYLIFEKAKGTIKYLQEPILYTGNDLLSLSITEKCSALIVASTISTGNKLNNISKELRDYENILLIYLVGIFRTKTYKAFVNLRNNLVARNEKTSKNGVHSLKVIHVPDNNSRYTNDLYKSPWDVEKSKLVEVQKKDIYNTYQNIVDERLKVLEENEGIENELFWCNPCNNDSELALMKNFAFYRFEDHFKKGETFEPPNQSEVYFVVSSILHNLRIGLEDGETNSNPKKKIKDKFLIQHEHMRSILSPENFVRFNDGVIQACILRNARPSELNYSIDVSMSHDMTTQLINLFKNPKSQSSEAILEFLYALWIGKICLIASDEEKFLTEVKRLYSDYEKVKFFLDLIEDKKRENALGSSSEKQKI